MAAKYPVEDHIQILMRHLELVLAPERRRLGVRVMLVRGHKRANVLSGVRETYDVDVDVDPWALDPLRLPVLLLCSELHLVCNLLVFQHSKRHKVRATHEVLILLAHIHHV